MPSSPASLRGSRVWQRVSRVWQHVSRVWQRGRPLEHKQPQAGSEHGCAQGRREEGGAAEVAVRGRGGRETGVSLTFRLLPQVRSPPLLQEASALLGRRRQTCEAREGGPRAQRGTSLLRPSPVPQAACPSSPNPLSGGPLPRTQVQEAGGFPRATPHRGSPEAEVAAPPQPPALKFQEILR